MTASYGCLTLGWAMIVALCALPHQHVVTGSKILLYPLVSTCTSHLWRIQKLGHILTEAGHEAHLVFPDMCSKHRLEDPTGRLVFIDLTMTQETRDLVAGEWYNDRVNDASPLRSLSDFRTLISLTSESFLQQPALMERLIKEDYDFGVFDQFEPISMLLLDHLDIPVMWFSNVGLFEYQALLHPSAGAMSYFPLIVDTPYSARMTFLQRVANFVTFHIMSLCWEYQVTQHMFSLAQKYGYENKKSYFGPLPEIAVYLVNTHPDLEYPRPLPSNVVMIGGIFVDPPKPLPHDWEEIVRGSENGVIMVSFGTNSFSFTRDTINRFARVFAQFKERVIWKYDMPEQPEGLGSNTLLVSWLPQTDLLAHPKTKLFVTHCGMGSIHEAAYNGVPIIGFPTQLDQYHNVKLMVDHAGVGKELDFKTFTASDLHQAMDEVINNATYRLKAQLLSRRFVDQPVTPRDLFLHWVDRVGKDGYLEHLQPRAAWELYRFQYYLIDVVGFLMLICASTFLLVFVLMKTIIACCLSVYAKGTKVKYE